MAKKRSRLTRRLEDYLEAVLVLVRRDGVARVRDIATQTNVSKSSVTAALKHLSDEGLINHDPYQYVTLTPDGRKLARKVLDKHELLKAFLTDVLNVGPVESENNACRMEHVVDDVVLERMSMLAEFTRQCPLGGNDWIEKFSAYCRENGSQGKDADVAEDAGEKEISESPTLKTTMDQLKPGQTGKILKVGGGVGPARRRLMDMGLTPGTPFEVERVAPLGDPIEIRLRNYHLTLRKSEAGNIVVEQTTK